MEPVPGPRSERKICEGISPLIVGGHRSICLPVTVAESRGRMGDLGLLRILYFTLQFSRLREYRNDNKNRNDSDNHF
jgi:hypothetical protein